MQHDQDSSAQSAARPRLGRTRFVGLQPAPHTTGPLSTTGDLGADPVNNGVAQLGNVAQPRAALVTPQGSGQESLPDRRIAHLMQLSGMLRPLRTPDALLPEDEEDGYWPLGIQQAGPLSIINLYGHEPFGRTLPSAVPLVTPADRALVRPAWQRVLTSPACKISYGLLIGLGLIAASAFFVDLPATIALLSTHLLTPQGIGLGLLAGLAFLLTHALRGLRWKFFLNPVGQVSILQVLGLSQVAALLNFLLPVRAGEAAKSLALKRIAHIPISKSLPTVAADKALDLLPALVILVLLPWLGMPMDLQLWIVLGLAGFCLLILLLLSVLVAWKRSLALKLLQNVLRPLPRIIGNSVEGFISGFVDALLAGISRPLVFLPALLLAALATLCDSLFILLAFWTLGFSIGFGAALVGATLCMLCSLLPTPPGQFGSNEAIGLLIFSGLLGLPTGTVAAMYIFTHPLTALLLTIAGLASLLALGLNMASALRIESKPEQNLTPSA